jgi:preprotein translocase subunit YajC
MQIEPHAAWTSLSATLAQGGNANPDPVFNQANPGTAPAPSGDGASPTSGNTAARPLNGPAGPGPGSSLGFMLPLFIVLGGVILLQVFTARKQEKKRRSLLSSVKKYDKVVTVGGIIGTVVELRDDEVVLKVDDHSSTKIRFTRSAIQTVLRAPEESKGAEVVEAKGKGESVGAKG